MKMLIKPFLFLATIVLTTNTFSADTYYSVILAENNKYNVIEPVTEPEPVDDGIEYFTEFDLTSEVGVGEYTNNNNTVELPSASTVSKYGSIYNFNDVEEVRVKFSVGLANYANAMRFVNAENNNIILQWYNYNDAFYVFDENNNIKSIAGAGQGSIMEIRLNNITKEYSFITDGTIVISDTYTDVLPETVTIQVFEGSNSSSSLTLLSE